MVANDYADKCTVLLKDVLEALFRSLESRGVLDDLYDKLTESSATRATRCSVSQEEVANDVWGNISLSASSMAGILYLHVFCSLVAIILASSSRCRTCLIRTSLRTTLFNSSGFKDPARDATDEVLDARDCPRGRDPDTHVEEGCVPHLSSRAGMPAASLDAIGMATQALHALLLLHRSDQVRGEHGGSVSQRTSTTSQSVVFCASSQSALQEKLKPAISDISPTAGSQCLPTGLFCSNHTAGCPARGTRSLDEHTSCHNHALVASLEAVPKCDSGRFWL